MPASSSRSCAQLHGEPLPAAADLPHPAPLAAPGGLRVLLIDDDRLLLDSMDGILRRAGLTVVARDSAADAVVDLVRDGRFDLILTDLSMSDLDGVAFFGLVRRLRPDLVGRVIFVTGGALTARAKSLLDERPDQVLHKPFSRTSLLEAVARFGREA